MTDEARFLKKKSDPKLGFLKFGSLVFLKIAYNDSLQECITSSRGKTHTKILGDKIWAKNRPKSGLELGFLPFSQVWFVSFP